MSSLPFEYVSPSQINTFAGKWGCELAYRYKYLDNLPTPRPGASLLAGIAFDRATTLGYAEKIETGENPVGDLLAETWLDAWRKGEAGEAIDDEKGEAIEFDLTDAPPRAASLGPASMEDYGKLIMSRTKPLSVQREVNVEFEGKDWRLHGRIDLVAAAEGLSSLPGVLLVDAKATTSSNRKFTHAAAATDPQLLLYELGLTMAGENVVGRGWHSQRILKTMQDVGETLIASRPEHKQLALDTLQAVTDRMEDAYRTGDYRPTAFLADSPKCSERLCDFWKSCPFGAKARVTIPITREAA